MEGYHAPIYDYFSLFAARAHILQLNQNDLKKYLDAPAVYRGDLYYIQNLVYTMEASTSANLTPAVEAGNNQTITLPDDDVSLDATVTDDGLPRPARRRNTNLDKAGRPRHSHFRQRQRRRYRRHFLRPKASTFSASPPLMATSPLSIP